MSEYHFGVPGIAIWLSHILFGLYFIYLGYKLNSMEEYKIHGLVLFSVGILMLAYHAHLWFFEEHEDKE